jgi:hypothetical protein
VSLLIINTDRSAPHSLMLPTTSERYTLDAASLRDTTVRLNGLALRRSAPDDLPRIEGVRTAAGTLTFAPALSRRSRSSKQRLSMKGNEGSIELRTARLSAAIPPPSLDAP